MKHGLSTPRIFGFSLLEILIAMVIVGVGLIALARFSTTGLKESNMSQQRVQAVTLGEKKIEELRAQIVNGTDFANLGDNNDAPPAQGNTNYARTWTVTTTSSGAKQINMNVRWTDRAGQQQDIFLTSVVSKVTPKDASVSLKPVAPPGVSVVTTGAAATTTAAPTTAAPTTAAPTTAAPTTTADPDTVQIDEIDCECTSSGSSQALTSGSHTSKWSRFSNSTTPKLVDICDTCCGIATSGGGGKHGGMMKPLLSSSSASAKMGSCSMSGCVTKTCDVFQSGRMGMH